MQRLDTKTPDKQCKAKHDDAMLRTATGDDDDDDHNAKQEAKVH